MKKILLAIVLLISANALFAQNSGTLKGKLVDTSSKQSLKDASIVILSPKDSTLEQYTLAKEDGSFEMRGIVFKTYLLRVSFQGYAPYFKTITLSAANNIINLGNVYMKTKADDLPTVVVKESPVRMKGDTVEFNASSFKTKPNAVAEDLINKLPGMEVDKSGTIKAQGETVSRVLVNGKRFFGDDPRTATRNLPPDMIDKIQVFDDLSDQSKFTGFDDGNRVKTLNITTKKDKSTGYFGKAVVGAGSAETYNGNMNLHRFNGNQQISIIGEGNNINAQNFNSQNIGGGRGGFGGGGGGGSNNPGITTTWAGGLNYRDNWGKNTDVSGSYFYNNQRTVTSTNSLQQTFFPNTDSSNISNSGSYSLGAVNNHRINLNIESKLDSAGNNSLVFRPNITIQNSTPSGNSSTSTVSNGFGVPIYTSTRNSSSINSGYNINGANLQLRHKFAKKYRTISLDINFSNSLNQGYGNNYSINSFYKPFVKTDTINQYYTDTSRSYTISPTLSYTEPIGKNQILEFRYNFSYNENKSVNNTYRFDNSTHGYTRFDSLYSNSYNFNSTSNNLTLSYRMQQQKYNFNIGTGIRFTDYRSDNITKNITVANKYVNFTPNANFVYNFSRSKALRIFYNGSTGQPSVAQLQPIATTSDSINFQIGNPNLKPQFTHSIRALFNSFDPLTQRVLMASLNASMITNDIQNQVILKSNGGRTTTYTNLNGTYNVNGFFLYGIPLKKPKSNLNFQTNIGYTQAQNLIADSANAAINNFTHNYTRNTNLGETIKWTTNLKDNFDMNFSGKINYTIARNDANPNTNLNYFSYGLSTDATYYTKSGWIVAFNLDYTYYDNGANGYNASVPLLSPSIAKQFLKNKAGELRLSCFDLLNQNQSVSRTVTSNYVTDTRSNVLTRYVMLTFTFNLRNFAQGQQGQRHMPGFFGGGMGGGGNFGGGGFGGGRRGN